MKTLFVLTPLGLLLTGCLSMQTPTTVTIDSRCQTDKIITYSAKSDSKETVDQVRYHNASLRALCDMR